MLILPHVLDVSVKYTPIHNFLPQKSEFSPFILPDPFSSEFTHQEEKWLRQPISGKNMDEEQLTTAKSQVKELYPDLADKKVTDYAAIFHALKDPQKALKEAFPSEEAETS